MKTKNGFQLRDVCGEKIIVATGRENIDFSKIITMNESSALLWESIQNKEFTISDMADILVENYEIDRETAEKDAKSLIDQWSKVGIIE